MNKRILVVLAQGFEDIEGVTAIDVLRRAQVEVVVKGLGSQKIKGSRGTVILTDMLFEPGDENFDALVLPGGMPGASNLAASQELKSYILRFHAQNKIIAAICASPAIVLAPVGILKNKSATCFPGMQSHFSNDVMFRDERVVVDANVITSQGPGTAIDFALTVVEKLCGKEAAQKVREALLA